MHYNADKIISLRQPTAANAVFGKDLTDVTLTNLPKDAPRIVEGEFVIVHAGYESPRGEASPGAPHADVTQSLLGVAKVDKAHQTRAMISLRLASYYGALKPAPYHMSRSIEAVANLPKMEAEGVEEAVREMVSAYSVRMNLNGPASLNPSADGWTGD